VIHFSKQNLLIGELLNWPIFYPGKITFIFEVFNVILIWLIARRIFKEKFAILPVLIWVISPWIIYETVI